MGNTQNPSKEEIEVAAERAKRFYHDDIKHQLTDADKGRYIAIDGNTGEWEIGDSDDVVDRLKARVPDALVHTITHITMVSEYLLTPFLETTIDIADLHSHQLADDNEEFGK